MSNALDPLPAVLMNSRFDIIQTNDAREEMFWDWHSLPCVHKNTPCVNLRPRFA